MNVGFCWSANTGVSMSRSPMFMSMEKNVAYEFLLVQLCPACLICLTWMICKKGGK